VQPSSPSERRLSPPLPRAGSDAGLTGAECSRGTAGGALWRRASDTRGRVSTAACYGTLTRRTNKRTRRMYPYPVVDNKRIQALPSSQVDLKHFRLWVSDSHAPLLLHLNELFSHCLCFYAGGPASCTRESRQRIARCHWCGHRSDEGCVVVRLPCSSQLVRMRRQ